MREHVSQAGNTIYFASRHELEALPGYRGNDRTGRACCPIHAGDNPTALAIDWATGWAHCYACGDAWAIRVADHPDTKNYRQTIGKPSTKPLQNVNRNAPKPPTDRQQTAYRNATIAPGRTKPPQRATNTPASTIAALERLQSLAALWAAAYAGSPAAAYVRARGIPDDIARALGWGHATDNQYLRSHRLFIPYTDPAGQLTGGAGRALDGTTHPKYLTLRNADGYRKTLVNGGAIAQARAARLPLVIVEGPFDAAACLAGGLPHVIALNGVAARPAWFAGIPRVFLANDADAAGREAVDRFRRTVPVHVASFDPDDLAGCKDVAGYWEQHGTIPPALTAGAIAPPMSGKPPHVVPLADLPPELREEAEETGLELSFDPEELGLFMADLMRREHLLSADDRAAAWHAIHYANSLTEDDPA
jgi:hypothetical protein